MNRYTARPPSAARQDIMVRRAATRVCSWFLLASARAETSEVLQPGGPPPDAALIRSEGRFFFSEQPSARESSGAATSREQQQLQRRQAYVASPPPYFAINTPPWAPGAMPPVPGPVFSKAFNALLVLLVIGCVLLGLNLRDSINRMYASEIGEDNEMLTRGGPGNAKWLESIQKTKGVCKGLAPAIDMPTPRGAGSKKAKKKSSGSRRKGDDDDDDGDALEMAPLSKGRSAKPKGSNKSGR